MFRTIKTLIAVAALSGSVGANVQAKEVSVQKEVHNASAGNIKGWNNLVSDLIHPENNLNDTSEKHYIVKQGDTLFSIAKENNISAQSITAWNDLYTNLVHPGLNLVIYDDPEIQAKIVPDNQLETLLPGDEKNAAQAVLQSSAAAPIGATLSQLVPVNAVSQQTATQPANITTEASVQASASESTPVPAPQTTPAQAPTPAPAPAPAAEPPQSAVQAPTPAPAPAQTDASKEITVKATAYTASCKGCSGITKTGVDLKANPDEKVIAVDPSVIPLGSKVYIEGYGEATAADTGGAIKGNRIDVYMQSESDALQFGAKELTVKILN